MKTSELTGAALDWAVAKCEDEEVSLVKGQLETRWTDNGWKPSSDWAQGGPIIEREVISLIHPKYDCWTAHCYDKTLDDESYTLDGPTPLIAAMRCYVASKLGDEIDVPGELL
jgi:hypothetical protein